MDTNMENWILCPVCGKGKVLHVLPGTRAVELEVFCRRCRQRSVIDVAGPKAWDGLTAGNGRRQQAGAPQEAKLNGTNENE